MHCNALARYKLCDARYGHVVNADGRGSCVVHSEAGPTPNSFFLRHDTNGARQRCFIVPVLSFETCHGTALVAMSVQLGEEKNVVSGEAGPT